MFVSAVTTSPFAQDPKLRYQEQPQLTLVQGTLANTMATQEPPPPHPQPPSPTHPKQHDVQTSPLFLRSAVTLGTAAHSRNRLRQQSILLHDDF
jgi:hypothetical protein